MATLTADDIPVMLEDPEFQALPWTEQRDLTEQAIVDAGSQMASSWTPDDYKAWGDFTTAARETVRSREGTLDYVGRKVGEGAAVVGEALTGMAADIGTMGLAAGELVHPAGWESGLPISKAFGQGLLAGTDSALASAGQFLAPLGGAGTVAKERVMQPLSGLKAELDNGDFPMDDAEKFAEWVQKHDSAMMQPRAKWFANVRGGGMALGDEANLAEESNAWANGLSRPDNAALVASYMVTRDPATWKQLEDNLLQTPDVGSAKAAKEEVLKTPGAAQFERAFGKGSSQHLVSASNPLNLIGYALPIFRGAAAVKGVSGAMGAREAARTIGGQIVEGLPENLAAGAASAIEENPNATAADIATGAALEAGAGGVLTGGIGGLGYGVKRGFTSLRSAPAETDYSQGQTGGTNPQNQAPGPAATPPPTGAGMPPPPAGASSTTSSVPGSAATGPTATTGGAVSQDVSSVQAVVPSDQSTTPVNAELLPLTQEVQRIAETRGPDHPLTARVLQLQEQADAGLVDTESAVERLQLAEAAQSVEIGQSDGQVASESYVPVAPADTPAAPSPVSGADLAMASPTLTAEQHYLFDSSAGDVAPLPNGGNFFIFGHSNKLKDAKASAEAFNKAVGSERAVVEPWLKKNPKGGKPISQWTVLLKNVSQEFVDDVHIKMGRKPAPVVKESLSTAPAMRTLRTANQSLPPKAQQAWTDDVYAKADKFFASGNDADLAGLNPIQKRRIIGARIESDPALRAEELAQEKAVLQQQRADAAFARNTTDPARRAMDEEVLSRTATGPDPFARAGMGDESAYADMEAAFRARYGSADNGSFYSTADELASAQRIFTADSFERVFEDAFQRGDFDTFLESLKLSDRAVWSPLLKRFFVAQANDPTAATKADWFRSAMAGTRPAGVAAAPPSAPQNTAFSGTTPQAAASSMPPPPPPPRAAAAPPPDNRPPPSAPPAPRIPVNPLRGGLAKSPYQIINDFSAAIGKSLNIRRMGKNQLGSYKPGSTLTAARFAGDLDTVAHELAGHWMDDKHGIGKAWAGSATSPFDSELSKFWIHGSPATSPKIQRAEGIAEYFRAYVMDPQATMAAAPKFSQHVAAKLSKEALKAINAFSDDVRTWAGVNPLARAALNIRTERPSLKERLKAQLFGDGRQFNKTVVDKFVSWMSDEFHYATKGFDAALAAQGRTRASLKPSENFELLLRWMTGMDARFSDQLHNGLLPMNVRQVTNAQGKLEVQRKMDPVTGKPMNLPWLLEAFDNSSEAAQKQDMREVSGLMVAERTLEKARQIDAEAQAALANVTDAKQRQKILADADAAKSRISGLGAGMMSDVTAAQQTVAALRADPAKARRLNEAARRYRAWADANLELLVESGRMSAADVAKIRAENAHYVDMHRVSEEFELAEALAGRGGSVHPSSAKDVIKRFKGSTLEIDNVYASLLRQSETIQKEAARNRVMRSFVDQLGNARTLYDGAPVELDRIGSRAVAADRNTVQVFRDGKLEHWKLDPDIHKALKGFGDLGSHALIEAVSVPQQIARYLITRSPAFVARNVLRDAVSRSVVSNTGSRPWDILQGYTDADKSRMTAFGGGMFGHYGKDKWAWEKELKRGMKELRKDPRNILMTPVELWKAWDKVGENSEALGRVAEFRRAYDKAIKELKYSPEEAALWAANEARGLIDFAKMGSVMRQVNKIIPFSNAAVRGLSRSANGALNDPLGFATRWGLFVLAPTLAVRMLAQQQGPEAEEEYQQLPAWQRDMFWNIKVGSYWLRLPKPHELGVMAGGVERWMSRQMGEKNSFDGYGGSVGEAFVPVNSVPEMLGPLRTPVEIMTNKDFFRDRDIVPTWEKDLRLDLRKGAENASMTGKAVSAMLGVDPRYIDHYLGAFGGLGQAVKDFTTPERKLGESTLKATGMVLPPVSSQSKDFHFVTEWAKQTGNLGEKNIKALRDLAQKVYDAKTPQEADEIAKQVRRRATELRGQLSGMRESP